MSFIQNMQSGNERLLRGYYIIYPACAIGFVSKADKEDL